MSASRSTDAEAECIHAKLSCGEAGFGGHPLRFCLGEISGLILWMGRRGWGSKLGGCKRRKRRNGACDEGVGWLRWLAHGTMLAQAGGPAPSQDTGYHPDCRLGRGATPGLAKASTPRLIPVVGRDSMQNFPRHPTKTSNVDYISSNCSQRHGTK